MILVCLFVVFFVCVVSVVFFFEAFLLFVCKLDSINEGMLKVALQILERIFTKILKKSPLYTQGLLILIRKTPIVGNLPTTREIRELLRPRLIPTGITVYFYMSSSLIHILEIHKGKFQNSV